MAYQKVFQRYELKYMITAAQKERILAAMEPYMFMDKFGKSTVRNIYFDTDDYILARHSIAKPDFKEKLRIRSYSRVGHEDKVFVELKRKFDSIVYKRRVALPEEVAMRWTTGESRVRTKGNAQLFDEINYFLEYYKNLRPVMYLSYDRLAYRMKDPDSEFRVTFDQNVLCREYDMSLTSEAYGTSLLEDGKILMELKCPGAIPMWMVQVLSEEKIYKTSFSKYGTAYTRIVLPELAEQYRKVAALEQQAEEKSASAEAKAPANALSNVPARRAGAAYADSTKKTAAIEQEGRSGAALGYKNEPGLPAPAGRAGRAGRKSIFSNAFRLHFGRTA